MYRLPSAVGVLLLAGLSLATGQNIKLRLVNAKSGTPLSKVTVSMHAWNGTFDIHKPDPKQMVVEATTNGEGVAVFHMTNQPPSTSGSCSSHQWISMAVGAKYSHLKLCFAQEWSRTTTNPSAGGCESRSLPNPVRLSSSRGSSRLGSTCVAKCREFSGR
jgi:hypothetical protein